MGAITKLNKYIHVYVLDSTCTKYLKIWPVQILLTMHWFPELWYLGGLNQCKWTWLLITDQFAAVLLLTIL